MTLSEIRKNQAEKWAEVQRLAGLCVTHCFEREYYIADLLAEIGVIHNTPDAKANWRRQELREWKA